MKREKRIYWFLPVCFLGLIGLFYYTSLFAQNEKATIFITIKVNGEKASGIVQVFANSPESREVAKGKSEEPIQLPPGEYYISVTCTSLIDEPVHKLPSLVTLKPGQKYEQVIKFTAGTIILQTYKDNQPLKGKPLKLKAEGSSTYFNQKGKTWEPLMLSPGTYEAEVEVSKKSNFIIKGIQVYEGSKRTLNVDVQ